MNKTWTEQDEKILVENKDEDWESLAKLLNKSEKAVRSKFHKMGLKRIPQKWTEEEIEFLITNYRTKDWDLLCGVLHRKVSTIKAKAISLGLRTNKRWTDKEVKDLRQMYPECSHEFLVEYFDMPYESIKQKALSLGLRRKTNKRKWTEEENDFVLKNYHDLTCAEMGEFLGRTAQVVQAHLYFLNLSQEHSRYYLGKAQYKFKRDYFDFINTPEKAYWFGFIWGDGWIGKWGVGCCLQETDKEHLKKLNKALNGNVPVRTVFQKEHYNSSLNSVIPNFYGAEIRLHSKRLSDGLKKYGMAYRNTYNHCHFPNIEDRLKIHFIRGLFDADGSVSLTWPADVCCGCNRELFLDIREFLYREYGIYSNLHSKKGINCFYYNLRCNSEEDTLELYNALYEDFDEEQFVYLERKYNKFIERFGKNKGE